MMAPARLRLPPRRVPRARSGSLSPVDDDGAARVRLRQAVLVADQLEPVASALRSALGLREPFRDPGVGEFGLANVVFALGDCFLEVVSPTRADTAAGRYLERHGGDTATDRAHGR